MKRIRNSLKIMAIALASAVGLLLLTAVAVPILFTDEIMRAAKTSLNTSLDATVDFADARLSLIRRFPNLSLRLDSFSIAGKGDFDGITLLQTEAFFLTIDLWSVLKGDGPYEVKSFSLYRPVADIIVLQDGRANYDIYRPAERSADASGEPVRVRLESYDIREGSLRYLDKSTGWFVDIRGLNHRGSGDLSSDRFDLDTRTEMQSLTVDYGGIAYLNEIQTGIDLVIAADLPGQRYTIQENEIRLNALSLQSKGLVQIRKEGYWMDLSVNAPKGNFKEFLSLIPGAYTRDFASVQAQGNLALAGMIKGIYNSQAGLLPVSDIKINIDNGGFQYPGMPLAVSRIAADMHLQLPGSQYDKMVLSVPRLQLQVGANPMEAAFRLRTPVSDPDVDGRCKGTLHLADLAKAFPFGEGSSLRGTVQADLVAKARMSYIEKQQYDRVNMRGYLQVKGVEVAMPDYPKVTVRDWQMHFSPQHALIPHFDIQWGKSDIKGSGKLEQVLALFSPAKTMTGHLMIRSGLLDLDEWMAPEEPKVYANPLPKGADGGYAASENQPFDRFDLEMDAQVGRVAYAGYPIRLVAVKGRISPEKMHLNAFSALVGKSDIKGEGILTNWYDYAFNNETLGGKLVLHSRLLDLNEFMASDATSTTTTSAATTAPYIVPSNWNLDIQADAGKVLYSTHQLDQVKARVLMQGGEARLTQSDAGMLGGRLGLTGAYDTRNPEKPKFNMKINIRDFDFQRTYAAMNTFQRLAPIARFITGKFNTDLGMAGELGNDLMPVFNTLDAVGLIETFNAVIRQCKPLEEVGKKLHLDGFSSFQITNTKNLFEIRNGSLLVQEFPYQLKEIGLRIGGTHHIMDQVMDFNIKTRIPRKLLEQNAAGAAAGAGYNALLQEASKYGIPIRNSEFVNVLFHLTGSLLKPQVGMQLLREDGQSVESTAGDVADAVVEKAKDTLRTRASQEWEKGKEQVHKAADKVIDTLTKTAEKQIETAKGKVVEEVKQQAGKVVDKELGEKAGQKVEEAIQKTGTPEQVKKEAEKLKNKLDTWDPFQKKPTGGGGG